MYKTAYWTGALLSEAEVDLNWNFWSIGVNSNIYTDSDLTGMYLYKETV